MHNASKTVSRPYTYIVSIFSFINLGFWLTSTADLLHKVIVNRTGKTAAGENETINDIAEM